jgi:hypothetical protein
MIDAAFAATARPLRTVCRRSSAGGSSRRAAHEEQIDSARRACTDDHHECHPLGQALSFEHRDRVRATILKLSPKRAVGSGCGTTSLGRRPPCVFRRLGAKCWAAFQLGEPRRSPDRHRRKGDDDGSQPATDGLPEGTPTARGADARRDRGARYSPDRRQGRRRFRVVTESLSLETLQLLSARALAAAHSHRRPTLTWLAPGCR